MVMVKIAARLYVILATCSFLLGLTAPSDVREMIAQIQTRVLKPTVTQVYPRTLLARAPASELVEVTYLLRASAESYPP
jgi:hypothetical protein